jgi:hypothetical protein
MKKSNRLKLQQQRQKMKLHTTLLIGALIFLLVFFSVAQMNAAATQDAAFDYPASVLEAAGIAPADITKHRSNFKNDTVHREWMQHVHSLLPDLDARTENTVVHIHSSFLYIKAALDTAYRKRKINRDTFENQVGQLFNWFQNVHSLVLNPAQYQAIFTEPEEKKADEIDGADEPLGFPVENTTTSIEMIKEKVDERTIEAIRALHQQRKQEMPSSSRHTGKEASRLRNLKI